MQWDDNDSAGVGVGRAAALGTTFRTHDRMSEPRVWMQVTPQGRCFIASGVGLGAVLMPCPLEGLDLDAIPDDLTRWNPDSKDRPLAIGELWGELQKLRAEVAGLRARQSTAWLGL